MTSRHARRAFDWLLGDDDLLADGASRILEGLATHPDVGMAYMDYRQETASHLAKIAIRFLRSRSQPESCFFPQIQKRGVGGVVRPGGINTNSQRN